jgi:hypothetical protein
MAPLSDGQVLATAICAGVGCFLSILGSSCIVYSIVSKRKYNRDPYHRLLLGMSLMDVIHSFWFAIGPVLVPKDSSQRSIALGSTATCSASGFFAQFGISVFLYSAMLSIYYVLTIRYSVTMSHMIRREKIMHCVAIFYPLLTAFSGLPLGLYNEIDIGLGCWINDFPDECTVNGRGACVRGYNAFLYGYFFSLIPAVMSFLVVLFSNVLIFLRARHVEHANRSSQRFQQDNGPRPGPTQLPHHRRFSTSWPFAIHFSGLRQFENLIVWIRESEITSRACSG